MNSPRTPRRSLRLLSVAVLLAAAAPLTHAASPGAKPNVVFIFADDLGYADIGVFGQNARRAAANPKEPWHQTPQLDRLAREGVQMRHHYCPAPVCAPSRASLMLGVHQGHANIRDNQFDEALANNHTIATVLEQAGYATAAIGKWGLQGPGHSPIEWEAYPIKRGFDYYFGYARHVDGHEQYPKEGLIRGTKECYDGTHNITPQLDKCYTTDLFTARAKKWIVDHHANNRDQPFFLYLAYATPHAALEVPTQAYPAGGGLRGGLQWLGEPGRMINTASGTVDSYIYPEYASATWDDGKNPRAPWPDVYRRYATLVRRIDDCVGDVRQLLRDLGIDENTIVVFSSDNGPSQESYLPEQYHPDFFNSFGAFDGIKRDVWEGGIRIPTIVRWPSRIPAGRVDDTPSGLWDWLATFADAAGVPVPARSDGVSLLPALTGRGTQQPSNVYIEYNVGGTTPKYTDFAPVHRGRPRQQMQAIRFGEHMGVRYNIRSHADDFEIYNVVSDPQQLVNLAREPAQAEKFAAMQQRMKDRVLQTRMRSPGAPRPYDENLVPATKAAARQPGLDWKRYDQAFPWLPELTRLTADAQGKSDAPTLDAKGRDKQFALLFTGFLEVPADGEYTFSVYADARALMRLHDATVVDADFGYGYAKRSEATGRIRLQAGLHPIRLYYATGTTGQPKLEVFWSGPGIEKQMIPAKAFFRGTE